jgi:hypothetical protein
VGQREFEPTSLERYRRSLADTERYGTWLRGYERLLTTFQGDVSGEWVCGEGVCALSEFCSLYLYLLTGAGAWAGCTWGCNHGQATQEDAV